MRYVWAYFVLIAVALALLLTCSRASAYARVVEDATTWSDTFYLAGETCDDIRNTPVTAMSPKAPHSLADDCAGEFFERDEPYVTDDGDEATRPVVYLVWHVWCADDGYQERITPRERWEVVRTASDGHVVNMLDIYDRALAMPELCRHLPPTPADLL